jgi:hypothetical protein
MYDEFQRSRCESPTDYDRMIALIVLHNNGCKDVSWAANAVNNCIRGCSEGSKDYSTGLCMALWGQNGVRLFLTPSSADRATTIMAETIREQFKDKF